MTEQKEDSQKSLVFSTASRPDISGAIKDGVRVIPVEVEDQMKDAYLNYAMSVIVGRALPDVRDGLKPVHRRILYAMHDRAWRSDRPFVKCAKIVGEVIGNFHPHGDVAVYDTLVRLVQTFSLRVPLIQGQGNFGSIDGDSPAAYRYTEAKLAKVAEELLKDIDKETVNFSPNFDDTKEQPDVLPANFPNLIVNGSSGIAVGMATNIPPHNMNEVIEAVITVIRNPDVPLFDLLKIVPGPDFPTGGIIIGGEGLISAYTKGKGSIILRSKVEMEESKKGRDVIVITEIPYQVNKRQMLEKIGDLVNEKIIEGIAEILDLSNRQGIRIEIHIKKDYNSQVILNQLFKMTQLQISYNITMLAILNNKPKIFNLKEMLVAYAEHRNEVVIRRTQYDLKKAEHREHILLGLKIALDNIDEVIQTIRSSQNPGEAKTSLMSRFELTEVQTDAILDMRLQRLTSLEVQKIINELEEVRNLIVDLKDILASPSRIKDIICEELQEVSKKYGDGRKTEISLESRESSSFNAEDLIEDEDVVVQVSQDQFVKLVPLDAFRKQRRGGRGAQAGSVRKDDFIKFIQISSAHSYIMFFTNTGRVFMMKVYELPMGTKDARGKSLKSLINLQENEWITSICSFKELGEETLFMVTQRGFIKKAKLNEFVNAKKSGIIALGLREDDCLILVKKLASHQDIMVATKRGVGLRMDITNLRHQGRMASGVKGIRLAEGDEVVGMAFIEESTDLLVVTENGFGKRVDFSEFSSHARGGSGIFYYKATEKTGSALGITAIKNEDEVIIITQQGVMIRMDGSEISKFGRLASGITLVDLKDDDKVQDFAIISIRDTESE
ncbi:MAG: DNA gyrase subunit A [Leptospiraceae bacterium]|nr:DNA gyrase subunit A [Leptospiraceae bacterium]MCP5496263.1 DNA gyrase subunit A [Leptospiraceae bacterium]